MYASKNGGWTTARHRGYPTTDLPYNYVGFDESIKLIIKNELLSIMTEKFSLNYNLLSIGEMFIAKYEFSPNKQSSLQAHRDGHPFSFIINLNTPDKDFSGGEFKFLNLNALSNITLEKKNYRRNTILPESK
jgi:hypothetical protein